MKFKTALIHSACIAFTVMGVMVSGHAQSAGQSYILKQNDRLSKISAKVYGNPDGPTFEYLFNDLKKEGFTEDECYKKIIASASKISPVYNKDCVSAAKPEN